jgi:hypothetical protein
MIVRNVPRPHPRSTLDGMLVPARRFFEDSTGNRTTQGRIKARLRVRLHKGKADDSPFQTEYRRRLWSYLYHADKLYVPHAVPS